MKKQLREMTKLDKAVSTCELLNKSTYEPMKVKDIGRGFIGEVQDGICSNCENLVLYEHKFCPHCGQKLDWSESDE